MTKVAVIGIGQSLRGDDAVGLEAVSGWREKFPETASKPDVSIEMCELSGLALLDLLQNINAAVLVDAIQGQSYPGKIHILDEKQISAFTTDAKSAHGWGIAETLQLGYELKVIKTKIKVIGIQVEQMTMGSGLSKAVKDALPIVCNTIEEEINKLRCE